MAADLNCWVVLLTCALIRAVVLVVLSRAAPSALLLSCTWGNGRANADRSGRHRLLFRLFTASATAYRCAISSPFFFFQISFLGGWRAGAGSRLA